jgi:hypothetical protein
MATSYYQDPFGAPDYSAEGMPSLLSLSNLESLGRGSVAGLLDLPYMIEGMLRGDVDPRMPQRRRVVPSSEQVLATTPRMTQPTPQAGLLETAGAFMSPVPVAAVKPVAKAVGRGGKAVARMAGEEINAAMMGERGGLLGAMTPQPKFMLQGNNVFDPRFDARKLEQERLRNLQTTVVPIYDYSIPKINLADYQDYPFITSMSDRTRTGLLTDIDGVSLNRPVYLQGGQPYMYENPGQVWASGTKPASDIYKMAGILKQTTGKDPLYIPWVMSPSGSDFANMTGETMLSYAQTVMGKDTKKALDRQIKNRFIPDWKGLDDPASIDQFRNLSDRKRKSMKKTLLDKEFRNEGGLSIGEARLAIADPNQLNLPDASILNVGQVFPDQPLIMQSGHSAYPLGVPGQGLGAVPESRNIFDLLVMHRLNRGIIDPSSPSRKDIRTLEMKPYAGLLDESLLKSLGY